jgi:protein-S-isoprenylcysteine O-methyltransferase Ste14
MYGWRSFLFPERLLTFLIQAALVVYLIDPSWMAWSQIDLPSGLRSFGAPLAGLALAGMVWAFLHLGHNLGAAHTLVTTGPYRWVRHPMYSAWAGLILGYSLLTANWFVALAGLGAMSAVVRRAPAEESALRARFGDAYQEYAARTGRFFPRVTARGPAG